MIGFAAAWDALDLTDSVTVTNGTPEPQSGHDSIEHRAWRSHNFTGQLAEKIDGPPRQLKIAIEIEGGSVIGYTLSESDGHSYMPDAPTPQVARDLQWEAAKVYSDTRAAASFTLPGIGAIQTDAASREAIRILVDEARDRIADGDDDWAAEFVNEANIIVPVTAAQILLIYRALRGFLGACYAARQAVRDALDAALADGATSAEIFAIDITAGYPA